MGTTGKVWFLSFHSSCLSVAIVFILLQFLDACCPPQTVDLLCVCCGLRRTESKSELLSPNRLVLRGEVVCSHLTLPTPTVPRISVSLLSGLGGLLWLLWYLSYGLVLGELDLLVSPSI